jgi:hypothetical protein
VAVSGSYAYVVDEGVGLRVVNVANPASPVEVGYYDTPGHVCGVAVSGSYAYVADYYHFEIFDCSQATAVPSYNPVKAPVSFSLSSAYPNPFNSITNIFYEVPVTGQVRLAIYNLLGQQVAKIMDRTVVPGSYSQVWDARDIASGIYFCRMSVKTPEGEAGGFQQVRKLVLLK